MLIRTDELMLRTFSHEIRKEFLYNIIFFLSIKRRQLFENCIFMQTNSKKYHFKIHITAKHLYSSKIQKYSNTPGTEARMQKIFKVFQKNK